MLLLGVLTFSPAFAQEVVFQTGFEPPQYTLGPLAGQDVIVENTIVFSGTQAVSCNSTALTGQNITSRFLNDPFLEDIVTFDVHFMEGATGVPAFWDVASIFGDQGFIEQIIVNAGTVFFGTGSVPLPAVSGTIFKS